MTPHNINVGQKKETENQGRTAKRDRSTMAMNYVSDFFRSPNAQFGTDPTRVVMGCT
jgi:hypothetical protein